MWRAVVVAAGSQISMEGGRAIGDGHWMPRVVGLGTVGRTRLVAWEIQGFGPAILNGGVRGMEGGRTRAYHGWSCSRLVAGVNAERVSRYWSGERGGGIWRDASTTQSLYASMPSLCIMSFTPMILSLKAYRFLPWGIHPSVKWGKIHRKWMWNEWKALLLRLLHLFSVLFCEFATDILHELVYSITK